MAPLGPAQGPQFETRFVVGSGRGRAASAAVIAFECLVGGLDFFTLFLPTRLEILRERQILRASR